MKELLTNLCENAGEIFQSLLYIGGLLFVKPKKTEEEKKEAKTKKKYKKAEKAEKKAFKEAEKAKNLYNELKEIENDSSTNKS